MTNDNSLKEIEIKLSATQDTLEKVLRSDLFARHTSLLWQQKELLNQYIDSADYQLSKAKVALRVRKDGNQYIQTLKSKGSSVGGFSARDEFDWYLSTPELDKSLLVSPYWPKVLEDFDKSQLTVIFATDFVRKYAQFLWKNDSEEAQIEVAIDRGCVQTADKSAAICELELELKSGSAEVMLDFAIELATHFPLFPNDLSKAERGYRLLNPNAYKKVMTIMSNDASELEQVEYYLKASQYYWESYGWQADPAKLIDWLVSLQKLQALFIKQENNHLLELLTPILLDWQGAINATADQLHDKVSQELDNTRWGVFLLSVSRWLLNSQ